MNINIGVAVALGIIIGTVLFAVTQQPIWIVAGLIIGAAVGTNIKRLRSWLER